MRMSSNPKYRLFGKAADGVRPQWVTFFEYDDYEEAHAHAHSLTTKSDPWQWVKVYKVTETAVAYAQLVAEPKEDFQFRINIRGTKSDAEKYRAEVIDSAYAIAEEHDVDVEPTTAMIWR
jgi:hypothetical protein